MISSNRSTYIYDTVDKYFSLVGSRDQIIYFEVKNYSVMVTPGGKVL